MLARKKAGRPQSPPAIPATKSKVAWWRRNPRAIAIGAGLLGAVVCLGIILTLRDKTGRETAFDIPPGSKVEINAEGNVTVTPDGSRARRPPTAAGRGPLR